MSEPDTGAERSDDGPPSSVERALRNETRRRVVSLLCRQGGESSVGSIALHLADEGRSMPSVLGTLHDVHLPKLEARGVVEQQPDGTVRLREDPAAIEPYLED